ncbi:hypothetical protein EDC96DRAFT_125282 [Choanephora cucurbitarum]|nr:hypothetical protein EDC96DRAFT_125282 [Choanephora cucurbitarum]
MCFFMREISFLSFFFPCTQPFKETCVVSYKPLPMSFFKASFHTSLDCFKLSKSEEKTLLSLKMIIYRTGMTTIKIQEVKQANWSLSIFD